MRSWFYRWKLLKRYFFTVTRRNSYFTWWKTFFFFIPYSRCYFLWISFLFQMLIFWESVKKTLPSPQKNASLQKTTVDELSLVRLGQVSRMAMQLPGLLSRTSSLLAGNPDYMHAPKHAQFHIFYSSLSFTNYSVSFIRFESFWAAASFGCCPRPQFWRPQRWRSYFHQYLRKARLEVERSFEGSFFPNFSDLTNFELLASIFHCPNFLLPPTIGLVCPLIIKPLFLFSSSPLSLYIALSFTFFN